jgi:hypothetical protein
VVLMIDSLKCSCDDVEMEHLGKQLTGVWELAGRVSSAVYAGVDMCRGMCIVLVD